MKKLTLILIITLTLLNCGFFEDNKTSKKEKAHQHSENEKHDDEDEHQHSENEKHDDEDEHQHSESKKDGDDHNEGVPEVLKIKPIFEKNLKYETEVAKKTNFYSFIQLNGEVQPNPDNMAKVSSQLTGKIEKIYFKEGDSVKKGKLLLTINSSELYELQSQYLVAIADYNAEKKNIERLKNLKKSKLISKQEMLEAETKLGNIKQNLVSLEEKLDAKNVSIQKLKRLKNKKHRVTDHLFKIYSPISGIILNRNAIQGQQVDTNQELASIGDLSSVWFNAKIFEKDLENISSGSKAKVILNSYPNLSFDGKLTYIGNQIDSKTRTLPARIVLKNRKNQLKIGLFGKAKVVHKSEKKISVPEEAIVKIEDETYIFIKEKPTELHLRKVKLGRKSENRVEIINNLKEGEVFVSTNSFELKSILLKSSFEGHAH